MYQARVLADSISKPGGMRLTTLEVTFPRMVLSEFNTHRVFSRNSASSRAIPIEKQIQRVRDNPFVPEAFEANQKGMQGGDELDETRQIRARMAWLLGAERAVDTAEMLADSGVHKQWANRILEPYMWQTVIVTATEWDNFFKLRISKEAQPEIRQIATFMKEAIDESYPAEKCALEWHLPLIDEEDVDEVEENWEDYAFLEKHANPTHILRLISAGRCARVSYLTHDGRRDLSADVLLAQRLVADGHMSPFEHIATPLNYPDRYSGNFRGWRQFRKQFEETNAVLLHRKKH
jgi:hypothetical protein